MSTHRRLTTRRLAAFGAATALTALAAGHAFASRPSPGAPSAFPVDARFSHLRAELVAADPDEATELEHLLGIDDEDDQGQDEGDAAETETESESPEATDTPEPADAPEPKVHHTSAPTTPEADAENDDDQGEDDGESGSQSGSDHEEHDGGDSGSEHDGAGDD